MSTHENGIEEMNAPNNHGVCWFVQAAAFAWLTNNEEMLRFCIQRYKESLLPDQMDPDGSFPCELARTKPYGYAIFVLDNGLIKAIESFSPNKGTKLATFAARCIENEILMHLRSLKKTRKDVSLHDPIGTDKEGNEITLIDILGTEADDVVDKVQLKIEKSKIYRNLEILDDREKEVVVGRFGLELGGEERTQREIAKELGISRSYVSRIEKRALMKLYHEFYKAKR
ncbi:sigma-70 family RNA polymerase sigma factor [Paenibacillus phytorum]|nr:sigma-70 family RNA polymerase sigma factor [Paenibacillus phytorum]